MMWRKMMMADWVYWQDRVTIIWTILNPKGWPQTSPGGNGGKAKKTVVMQWCYVGTWWNLDKGPPKHPVEQTRRLMFPKHPKLVMKFDDSLPLKWYLSNETAHEVLTWSMPRSYQVHGQSGQIQIIPTCQILFISWVQLRQLTRSTMIIKYRIGGQNQIR